MKKHIFYCHPSNTRFNWEGGNLPSDLPHKLVKYGRVKVTFEKYVPLKSNNQMGYYRAGILPFLHKQLHEETGMSEQEWHEALKTRIGLTKADKSGRFVKIRSLANYTEKEMSDYIRDVIHTVFHFYAVSVPEPNKIEEFL